jgi:hypothetical protein
MTINPGVTYAAVAAKFSIARPLEKIPRAAGNSGVNTAMTAKRLAMLFTEYKTMIASTGRVEAQTDPTTALARPSVLSA